MKKYFILAAAALMMAACNNDERENTVAEKYESNVINLTAQVAGANAVTRAGLTIQSAAFDADEEINVECTPSGGSYANTLASAIYTTGAATGEPATVNALTLKDGETALRWPATGTVNINAYYPSSMTSAETSFTVQTDQSLEAGYKASDLMYATNIPEQAKTDAAVELTFNHALTKIIVNLSAAANGGLGESDIAGCTVTLSVNKTAAIDHGVATLTTGVYNSSDAATITMGTGASNAAIIAPQDITASADSKVNFITVTTAGNHTVTYQLAANTTFAAGHAYTYNLAVGMKAITLQSSSITNWTVESAVDATGNPLEI